MAIYDKSARTTRRYDYANAQRVAVGSAAADSDPIEALEVLLHATVKCYVVVGAAPVATAAGGLPLEAGEKFHLQLSPDDVVSVIRDAADGYLHIVPVDGTAR